MLNGSLGHIETCGDKEFIVVDQDRGGVAVYGPYQEYPPGRYVVTFELYAEGYAPNHADTVVAVVEVTSDNGTTVFEQSKVYASRLIVGNNHIQLHFTLEQLTVVEFRIHTTGLARLRICHERALAQISAAPLVGTGSFEVQQRALELLRLLRPHAAKGFHKARFGSPNDGGYIMLDDFDRITAAFSFGIEQNADWDVSIADRGLPVYQFDDFIEASPVIRPDLMFTKARIVPHPAPDGATIEQLVERHGTPGLPSLVLKIDIEHAEWAVFEATSEHALSCFAQIVGEFHGFDLMFDQNWIANAQHVFAKLTRQFAVVHVHANNYTPLYNIANIPVPAVLEITFANRSRYRLEPADEIFPGPLQLRRTIQPARISTWGHFYFERAAFLTGLSQSLGRAHGGRELALVSGFNPHSPDEIAILSAIVAAQELPWLW